MLVSTRWLSDYVEIPWSAEALAERLTMTGAKVEGVTRRDRGIKGVCVGRIVAVAPHPAGPPLQVCRVDVGNGTLQSVCGAPNVAVGQLVPVALPGAELPAFEEPVVSGEVKGVLSDGVILSEAELGVGDDHSGVMVLPADLAPGDDLVRALALDDAVIEFEIYPNRPDCLAVVGIAREVAAAAGRALKLPRTRLSEQGGPVEKLLSVRVEDPALCPRYMARVIESVRIGPSPAWLQERLRAAGMRPINNVVDVTNFVMLEFGQPLHAFDRARLAGAAIHVRRARDGETMTTLDGVARRFTSEDLLICDGAGPVAVAGVMGGLNSEVTEATQVVVLESATFDPVSVRKTSNRLGLRTEASLRFEKGLHPRLAALALERAAGLIAQLAGGVVARGAVDVSLPLPADVTVAVPTKRVNQVLGTQISPAEMKRILRSLEFGVELEDGGALLQVAVPWHRPDVRQEADVIEEIARMYGYDEIEATLPSGASVQGRLSPPLDAVERVRDRLAAAGFDESITYSFVNPKTFDMLELPAGHELRRAIPLRNPLSEEQSVMRTTLLGSLLEAVRLNERRQVRDVRLFELARVYVPAALPLAAQPEERWTLGVVLTGRPGTHTWGEPARAADFYDLKGAVEAVAELLGAAVAFAPAEHPSLHPGRTAAVQAGGTVAGYLGEVHPRVARNYELRTRTYVAELALAPLLAAAGPRARYRPLPRFPAVERDLALLVPDAVPAEEVRRVIAEQAGETLRSLELFDVYAGKQVPAGMRSIAYTLTFQADERTLTDEEMAAAHERIAAALKERLGVTVRA